MYLNWLYTLNQFGFVSFLLLSSGFVFLPSSTTLLRNLSSSCTSRPVPLLFENMQLQFLQIMEENYIILKAIALLTALNIHISTLLFPSPLTSSSAHTGAPSAIGELSPGLHSQQNHAKVLAIFHCHFRKGLTLCFYINKTQSYFLYC